VIYQQCGYAVVGHNYQLHPDKIINFKYLKMKKVKQIIVTIFILTFITSCDKDENELKETVNKTTISAKWVVSNSNEYKSFEFNESGNYIVVQKTAEPTNEQIILFGNYDIIDNKAIVLSDFGTLTIFEVNESSINFSFKRSNNPNNEIIIDASKKEEMESSTKTEFLCKTWKMVTINGDSVVGTDNELTVLFSEAGTYFVSFANPIDDNAGGLAEWKWNNETETHFLYSWEEVPVWDDAGTVEVPELTSNKLKIIEIDDIYILEPISN